MIAFIRVSFPTTPARDLWTDQLTQGFMDPAIPFSMAHFWKCTTFGQIDFDHSIFAPITVTDPRTATQTTKQNRRALVQAVFAELHRTQAPAWNSIDRAFIFFAQRGTELFGGGSFATPGGGSIPVAVFSSDSPFDAAAQEVGHAFGLKHEFDATGKVEYGCPYSVMSATRDLRFERALDARLPGIPSALGFNAPCFVGPYVPTAHLLLNKSGPTNPTAAFNHAESVTYVSEEYARQRQVVTLTARDVAIDVWPTRRHVLAVVPPITPAGDVHFLELRRPVEYDGAIGEATVVVLAANFWVGNRPVTDSSTLYLKHVGALRRDGRALVPLGGGLRMHMSSLSGDSSSATVAISADDNTDGLALFLPEPAVSKSGSLDDPPWETVTAKPCRRYPAGSYQCRVNWLHTGQVFTANAVGYAQPSFSWFVNDVPIPTEATLTTVSTMCRRPSSGGSLTDAEARDITYRTHADGHVLRLTCVDSIADAKVTVRVVASEPGSPDRSASGTGDFDNIEIEWDERFTRDRSRCLQEMVQEEANSVITTASTPGDKSPAQILRETLRLLGIGIPGGG